MLAKDLELHNMDISYGLGHHSPWPVGRSGQDENPYVQSTLNPGRETHAAPLTHV